MQITYADKFEEFRHQGASLRYEKGFDDWSLRVVVEQESQEVAIIDPPRHLPFDRREEMAQNTFELLKLRMKQE